MEAAEYVTDAPVATSVHLAMRLRKPLLIEGPAGVGKTEVAKVMARMLATNLIRLQCYEGLDASTALYEWNYQKQLLHIKLEEAGHNNRAMVDKEHEIFSEPFLLRRPMLQAITQESQSPVLLVDEVDRCVAARTLVTTTSGIKCARRCLARRRADQLLPRRLPPLPFSSPKGHPPADRRGPTDHRGWPVSGGHSGAQVRPIHGRRLRDRSRRRSAAVRSASDGKEFEIRPRRRADLRVRRQPRQDHGAGQGAAACRVPADLD